MTATQETPLVRDRSGAILGIDFRRTDLSPVVVPGRVRAQHVMPGDTVRLAGADVVVVTKRAHGTPGVVYVGVVSAGGAEVVHELRQSEPVEVVAVGAFDR